MSEIAEARVLLEAAGCSDVNVRADAQGVLVAAMFNGEGMDGQPYAGHTGIDPTRRDPRDLAQRLLDQSRANWARQQPMTEAEPPPEATPQPEPEAVEPEPEQPIDGWDIPDASDTEEPTFSPENDPLGPPAADDYGTGQDPLLTYTEGDEADEPIDEPKPQFIFGDNLATDRLVRIGQIAEHARTLIAETRAAIGWDGDEFAALQGYVVSHLNESGAFVGSDAAAFERFMRLSDAQRRERAIEIVRDEKQDHIRAAGHEAVAMFDVSADWP